MPGRNRTADEHFSGLTRARQLIRELLSTEISTSPQIRPRRFVAKYLEHLYPQLDEFSRELLFEQLIDITRHELKKNSERLTSKQFELDLEIHLPLCISVPSNGEEEDYVPMRFATELDVLAHIVLLDQQSAAINSRKKALEILLEMHRAKGGLPHEVIFEVLRRRAA